MTKTVLITGATSGFGAAMARRFAEAGWRVVATGRRVERLRTLVDEFGAETIAAAAFDVRDEAAMNDTLSALPEPFQGIDVLINNAGLALGTAPAPEARLDDWLTMIEANVTGLVTLTHRLLPILIEQGLGRPGESHPRAPSERSVTVSRHSARAILIIKGCLTHTQWAK